MSLGQDLAAIYGRELERLATEIEAYPTDEAIWGTVGAQKNPPGALALHTAGGLRAMVGAGLGGTSYVRDRDLEFSGRGVPRAEVARRVRECRDEVTGIIAGLDDAAMCDPYPATLPPALKGMTTQALLMQLLWHIGWHTGHVYYHRLGMATPDPAANPLDG